MSGEFYTVRRNDILVRVKAKPGAREDAVQGVRQNELLVSVRAAPEKGKANAEIARVLSRLLGIARTEVVLKAGGSASHKIFLVPLAAIATLKEMEERG